MYEDKIPAAVFIMCKYKLLFVMVRMVCKYKLKCVKCVSTSGSLFGGYGVRVQSA